MAVDFFSECGRVPLDLLLKDAKEKETKKITQLDNISAEKTKTLASSLEPFRKRLIVSFLTRKDQTKSKDQIERECKKIIDAFVAADFGFDRLSELYVHTRGCPKNSRNTTFRKTVREQLDPVWSVYAPPGADQEFVVTTLLFMGSWLFPDTPVAAPPDKKDEPKKKEKEATNQNLIQINVKPVSKLDSLRAIVQDPVREKSVKSKTSLILASCQISNSLLNSYGINWIF